MGKSFRDRNDWHDPEEVSERQRNSRINRENKQRDLSYSKTSRTAHQSKKSSNYDPDEHQSGSEEF